MIRTRRLVLACCTALILAACSGAASPSAALPSQSPPIAVSPTPAASSPSATGAIVTIRVVDEEYRILLTDEEAIATAEELAAGERDPLIPVGTIVRTDDGGVNTGYSWHIDPATFEWAEVTIEVCDGRPSFVEDGTLTGDTFCPWSAEVVSVAPAE